MWGNAFKIVTRKFGRSLPRLTIMQAQELLNILFPSDVSDVAWEIPVMDKVPFNNQEVREAGKEPHVRKAQVLMESPWKW